MAETPGESVIFIILAVVFIAVIVSIAGYLLLVGINLSNSGICYVSIGFKIVCKVVYSYVFVNVYIHY